MPRPSTTERIAVDADGSLLLWIDGTLMGNENLLAKVRRAAEFGITMGYTVQGPYITANLNNPVGATAALLAAAPGKVQVLEAPAAVIALYNAAAETMENTNVS